MSYRQPANIHAVMKQISFPEYEFAILADPTGDLYLQASYVEPDTVTGVPTKQTTRNWRIEPFMSESEIVQTAFLCIKTSMEHRTREWFRYRGHAVFGPHFDADDLARLCESYAVQRGERK